MIVVDWVINALCVVLAFVWAFLKEFFKNETIDEKVARATHKEALEVKQLAHKLDELMLQQHSNVMKMIDCTTALCSQVSDTLLKNRSKNDDHVLLCPIVLNNHIDRFDLYFWRRYNGNEMPNKVLQHYIRQCLIVKENLSIGWTNEHGIYIPDSDLYILTSLIDNMIISKYNKHSNYWNPSYNFSDIQDYLLTLVLQKPEVQQMVMKWMPIGEDVYRFVLLKYL